MNMENIFEQTFRPWGDFKQFALNETCTVKILTVKPYQETSLQYHNHRDENFYFLTEGYFQINDKIKPVKKGDFLVIPKRVIHRMIATNKELVVLEVAFGKFDENDEARLFDKYRRKLEDIDNYFADGNISVVPVNQEKEVNETS